MIHWVLWHNAVCENKCDRAATWLARDLHTSLVLLPALTCNATCACVCAFPAYLVLRVIESRWHISICMKGVKSERDAALYAGSCNGSGFSVFYIRCSRADRDEKKETAGKTNKANQNQADPNSDSSRAWWYRAFLIAVPQASDIYQILKKKKRLWWCSHCCLNSNMCSSSSQRGCRVRAQREVGQQKPCSSRLYIKDGHHKLIGALEFMFWVVTCWFFRLHY